jgi:hypothetical protein
MVVGEEVEQMNQTVREQLVLMVLYVLYGVLEEDIHQQILQILIRYNLSSNPTE